MIAHGFNRRAASALAAIAAWPLFSASVGAQIDAGLLARGVDREIAANYDASRNRTDVRLTLVPSGVGGDRSAITLVFVGQFAGRVPAGEATLAVRTHITPRSDPGRRDPRTGADGKELLFRIDPHTE